ncbi:hypothetical protein BHE74_00054339 [Ensete ventricosum]|nr:hypothetical protein BHE74_00054339 [Ensete ventricosum]
MLFSSLREEDERRDCVAAVEEATMLTFGVVEVEGHDCGCYCRRRQRWQVPVRLSERAARPVTWTPAYSGTRIFGSSNENDVGDGCDNFALFLSGNKGCKGELPFDNNRKQSVEEGAVAHMGGVRRS